MAPRNHAHQLAELQLQRSPAEWITERRAEGKSFRTIAAELHTAIGLDLAPETLRLWVQPEVGTPRDVA